MTISAINWPTELPQKILISGYAEAPHKSKIRTEMDSAVAKQRARFTTSAQPFTCNLLMTEVQYELFKEFFRNDIKMGTLPFNFPSRLDDSIMRVVTFTEDDYEGSSLGSRWQVTLNLEELP